MKNPLRSPFRRSLALLLSLLLCFSAAGAEEGGRVEGYTFSLNASLSLEEASASVRRHLQGYADLLDLITFRGSFYALPESGQWDLSLEILPKSGSAQPISLRFYNYAPCQILITSPLLGERPLLLSTDSLLAFAYKTYERLGLDMSGLVLLFPQVFDYATREIRYAFFRYLFDDFEKGHKASARSVNNYLGFLSENLSSESATFMDLVRLMETRSDYDETFRAEAVNFPEYLRAQVTKGSGLTYTVKKNSRTMSSKGKTFYTHTFSDAEERIDLAVPPTDSGFQPVLTFSSALKEGLTDADLSLGWISQNPAENQDLFSVNCSARSLPLSWPAPARATADLSLSGSLLPSLRLQGTLESGADGRLSLSVKNPAGSPGAAGGMEIRVSGEIVPAALEKKAMSSAEFESAVDILRVNDVTLSEWVSGVLRPSLLLNLLDFLAAVPASTYQTVMNDLTESGVLTTLFPVY